MTSILARMRGNSHKKSRADASVDLDDKEKLPPAPASNADGEEEEDLDENGQPKPAAEAVDPGTGLEEQAEPVKPATVTPAMVRAVAQKVKGSWRANAARRVAAKRVTVEELAANGAPQVVVDLIAGSADPVVETSNQRDLLGFWFLVLENVGGSKLEAAQNAATYLGISENEMKSAVEALQPHAAEWSSKHATPRAQKPRAEEQDYANIDFESRFGNPPQGDEEEMIDYIMYESGQSADWAINWLFENYGIQVTGFGDDRPEARSSAAAIAACETCQANPAMALAAIRSGATHAAAKAMIAAAPATTANAPTAFLRKLGTAEAATAQAEAQKAKATPTAGQKWLRSA